MKGLKRIFCFVLIFMNIFALPSGAMTLNEAGLIKNVLFTAYKEKYAEPVSEENTSYVAGTRYGKAVPDIDIYDTSTDVFFKNSLFVGDSLMEGFRTYCMSKGKGFLSDPIVLASKSFSLHQALRPVSESSRHPSFRGKKMLVEDAVSESGAEKVFLFFGINDMVGLSAEETEKEYNDLIFRIRYKNPNVRIYVIGATYIYSSGQKNGFTNERIRQFNDDMYKYCCKYDFLEFINIGDRLINSSDGTDPAYSSDKYVHMTTAGYDVWIKVLRAYAQNFMDEEAAAAQRQASLAENAELIP